MTEVVHVYDMRHGYVELVEHVLRSGLRCSPRDQATRELENFTFTVDDVSDVLPVGTNRKLNVKIAVIEALQLIGAKAMPELVLMASPNFKEYSEYDGHFHGAYGARVGNQLDHVVNKIKHDRDTRQAIITLWDPTLDNMRGFRDYPCTLALGFRLRGDRVNMSVTMRSNDVWRGTTYDVFQFTQMQWTIANMLGVEAGTYTHTAWSFHLYERDVPAAEELSTPTKPRPAWHPRGLSSQVVAARILEGRNVRPVTEDDVWYNDMMNKIVDDASGQLG